MATVTVVFESEYGQTETIAQRVAALAEAQDHDVRLRSVSDASTSDLKEANAVVILAPVYNRRHAKNITDFASWHRRLLAARPTAFFSVSLAAASEGRASRPKGAGRLVEQFLRATGLQPTVTATVGGGLNYPAYPRAMRITMRLAAFVFRFPTDTSRAHELTDWEEVERVTGGFLAGITE